MESEISSVSEDLMAKRNRLMNEVVSMRRKVPKILVALDEKIQKKKLKTLILKQYPLDGVREQLERYVTEKSPCEGRRVPNWQNDLKRLQTAVAKVEEAKALLEERKKNSIDISVLVKKSLEAQEKLRIFNIAQKQLANENPLITRARQEGYSHMMRHKIHQEEEENLESEVSQS